jgi:hypothetical protein
MLFRTRLQSLVLSVVLSVVACAAYAGKPAPVLWSDVVITYAGQTFGFTGSQSSFAQSQDGGRIVFNLSQLDTPGTAELPDIDVSLLTPKGNHWDVVSKVDNHSYTFSGTCASQTFTTSDSGGNVIRHLYLNCRDLITD